MAGGANADAGVGTGGMATKVIAARMAAAAGCATLVTLGARPAPLGAVEHGARATLFEPSLTPAAAYKAWIAGSLAPQGALVVDAGAAVALRAGKSLLPAGVKAVEGRFEKGDAVIVRGADGREIGRGLTRYDAADADRIKGLRSTDIEAALGFTEGSSLVHADDLALARRLKRFAFDKLCGATTRRAAIRPPTEDRPCGAPAPPPAFLRRGGRAR